MTNNATLTVPPRTLATLFEQLPPGFLAQGANALPPKPVRRITEDSRLVDAGTLFVAVPGMQQDGHSFIPQAISAGAAAIVGSHSLDRLIDQGWWPQPTTAHYLRVNDSREALAWLSAALLAFPSRALTVIGVTGTDGKTTTCSILEAILSLSAPVGVITTVAATIAGVDQETGLHVTTPDASSVQTLLAQMRSAGCGYAIVESTSFGLDQKRVAAVEYDVAALTNITHEHLDIHGSYEAYREAKFLLFRSLFRRPPKPGVPKLAVFNLDDSSCHPLRLALTEEQALRPAVDLTTHIYSLEDHQADLFVRNVRFLPDRTRFELVWEGATIQLESRLIGEFNLSNILCAAGVALGLGIPPQQVRQGVASLTDVLGRMQRIDGGQDFLAVVDFAHSPASLERALQTLRPLLTTDSHGRAGRLIAIFGCAGLRDKGKRRLMGQVSARLADFTIITAEDPRTEDLDAICREIADGIQDIFSGASVEELPQKSTGGRGTIHAGQDALPASHRFAIVPDRAEAIRFGVQMARAGDVVSSFGKGHERSMCFGETEYPWNEQESMLSALRERVRQSKAG